MTSPAAKGKTLWPALVAAAALLLTAPQAFASRTPSTRPELVPSPALEPAPATTAHALAPAYASQGFAVRLDADPHPAAFALFPDLTPPPAAVEPEKLASGVASWELIPNLQRSQHFVAEAWQVRENLGPVDSPNLYQAFGLDPQNNTDPLGLAVSMSRSGVILVSDEHSVNAPMEYISRRQAEDNPVSVYWTLVNKGGLSLKDADAFFAQHNIRLSISEHPEAMAPVMKATGEFIEKTMVTATVVGVSGGVAAVAAPAAAAVVGGTAVTEGLVGGAIVGVGTQGASDINARELSRPRSYVTSALYGAGAGGALALAGEGAAAVRGLRARVSQRVMQRLTTQANEELAANPAAAQEVLRPREYLAGTRSPRVAPMQYGNAVERMVAERIEDSFVLRHLYEHVGGPSQPDFIGRALFKGLNYDITTPGQVAAHLARPGYGQGLLVTTYQRPRGFRLFPAAP